MAESDKSNSASKQIPQKQPEQPRNPQQPQVKDTTPKPKSDSPPKEEPDRPFDLDIKLVENLLIKSISSLDEQRRIIVMLLKYLSGKG